MAIPYEEQVKLAKNILPLIDRSESTEDLSRLCIITEIIARHTGRSTLSFSLSEYAFEKNETLAKPGHSGDWASSAREAVLKELQDSTS